MRKRRGMLVALDPLIQAPMKAYKLYTDPAGPSSGHALVGQLGLVISQYNGSWSNVAVWESATAWESQETPMDYVGSRDLVVMVNVDRVNAMYVVVTSRGACGWVTVEVLVRCSP